MKPAIFEEVENQLIDALADGSLEGVSTVNMCHEVYNQSETYAYYEDAEHDLAQIDTFFAIRTVMQYEQDNFGQVAPAIQYGDPCRVADMVVYILGEALIYHVFGDDGDFQTASDITPEIAQRYSIMLDKALAEEPDLVAHTWQNL